MIRSIQIKNFKSLSSVHVDLGPFTVLIGKNGAGKSAFLQALDVLAWLVREASINEAFKREGVSFNEIVFMKAHTRRIVWECEVSVRPEGSGQGIDLVYSVGISKRRYVHVTSEWASFAEDRHQTPAQILDMRHPFVGRVGSRVLLAQEGDGLLKYERVPFAHSLLLDVSESKLLNHNEFPILSALASELGGFRHFQIWGPEPLRHPSWRTSAFLSERGENLPSVIADLKDNEPAQYSKLMTDVKAVYPWLDEIEIGRGSDYRFALTFIERPAEPAKARRRVKYSPAQVSDGFMRLLALTALRYQRGHVSILGYEEPENGLHPGMLKESVQRLREIAESGTQVIVTTHSPYLLDYLMETTEGSALAASLKVVLRRPDGATEILPVDEAKLAKAKAQGIGAGELWGLLVDERDLVGQRREEVTQ